MGCFRDFFSLLHKMLPFVTFLTRKQTWHLALFIVVSLLNSPVAIAQSDYLAKEYYRQGDFEKAVGLYEKLYAAQPSRWDYVSAYVESLQQLEQLDKVEEVLIAYLQLPAAQPAGLILLGDNFIKKDEPDKSKLLFNRALEVISINPNNVYNVARYFELANQLQYAIDAYQLAMQKNSRLNFDYQIAGLYGQMGEIEKMFESYITILRDNPRYTFRVQNNLNDFISDNPQGEYNILFRKLVLSKLQQEPDIIWNQMLSWLYLQEKAYGKALLQEKAIYNRTREDLSGVMEVADIAKDENQFEVALDGYAFVIKNAFVRQQALEAQLNIVEIEKNSLSADPQNIRKKYENLLNEYGRAPETIALQLAFARFLAFDLHKPDEASAFLKKTLLLELDNYRSGRVKMVLAEILVYQGRFNEAIVNFSQVGVQLKNDVLAHQARFMAAKTSYFKADFEWALTQLKVLKSSHTQLIANDALELHLLIHENILNDSLHTNLKKFAQADWLIFKNETEKARQWLEEIYSGNDDDPITDDALYKLARLEESLGNYEQAKNYYLQFIERYPYEVWMDQVLYYFSKMWAETLNNPDEAKPYLEKLIFDHPDSIFIPEAKLLYRKLRGDNI